ncbi:MAG: hypothetical protein JWN13_3499 [Betaproteobacteria bacterium]|jgi:hypothetical protein|nr:hypothetical protein [Betaproteobacteria bacterium]
MLSATDRNRELCSMLRVSGAADIEYLVKESEVLTGQPGRHFVISGADRLVYRLYWHSIGCKVQRLDDRGNAINTQFLLHLELRGHSLGEASRVGQLYTPAVRH